MKYIKLFENINKDWEVIDINDYIYIEKNSELLSEYETIQILKSLTEYNIIPKKDFNKINSYIRVNYKNNNLIDKKFRTNEYSILFNIPAELVFKFPYKEDEYKLYRLNICKYDDYYGLYITIMIKKYEYEYEYEYNYYKCDQINGLKNCLKYISENEIS